MSQHARNTAIFSGLTLISRVSGMVRIMVFAFAIGGRTVLADSYQLAYLIPSTIYEFIVGGLLSAIFIPLLVREQEKSGKNSSETWKVANLLLGAVGVLLAIAGVIGFIAAPWIIQGLTAMSSGPVAAEKQALATHLFRYFTPQIVLLGINAVCMAILNSLGVFAVTAAAPIINNIVVIACFIAYYYGYIDVTGLAIGTTLGTAAMILVQWPWLWKAGMAFRPRFNLRHPVFRSVSQMGWPIVLVSIANLLGWTVRANLLSTVLGAFAIYTLCFQIIMMPYGIFAVSIATVLYPTLSRHAANNRMDEFISDMALGFRWTTFILLPISLGVAALALPIVRVLFEHRGGQFAYADSLFTAKFLEYYALSIAPYALVMFATRVFYSRKDTATPAAVNIVGVVFNAIISYLLLKALGAPGIALGATMTYVLTTAASMFIIKRQTGGLGGRMFWVPMMKMAGAAALMAFVVNAAETWTRPEVVIMERGKRLAMQIPESGRQGNSILISDQGQFDRVWVAMDNTTATIPAVDFSHKTIALVWGPMSKTTSTLHLNGARIGDYNFELAATVAVDSTVTTATVPITAAAYPAYALVELNRPQAKVALKITVAAPGQAKTNASWLDSELLRLIMLVTTGACVYLITAWLFRLSELEKAINLVTKRFKRPTRE